MQAVNYNQINTKFMYLSNNMDCKKFVQRKLAKRRQNLMTDYAMINCLLMIRINKTIVEFKVYHNRKKSELIMT